MNSLFDIIDITIDTFCLIGGFILCAAIVLPIPIFLYIAIKNIIMVIFDALNGRLSKNPDGTFNCPESQERYKNLKIWILLILVCTFFVTPLTILVLVFGPIAILCVILAIPFYVVWRIFWDFLKKKT